MSLSPILSKRNHRKLYSLNTTRAVSNIDYSTEDTSPLKNNQLQNYKELSPVKVFRHEIQLQKNLNSQQITKNEKHNSSQHHYSHSNNYNQKNRENSQDALINRFPVKHYYDCPGYVLYLYKKQKTKEVVQLKNIKQQKFIQIQNKARSLSVAENSLNLSLNILDDKEQQKLLNQLEVDKNLNLLNASMNNHIAQNPSHNQINNSHNQIQKNPNSNQKIFKEFYNDNLQQQNSNQNNCFKGKKIILQNYNSLIDKKTKRQAYENGSQTQRQSASYQNRQKLTLSDEEDCKYINNYLENQHSNQNNSGIYNNNNNDNINKDKKLQINSVHINSKTLQINNILKFPNDLNKFQLENGNYTNSKNTREKNTDYSNTVPDVTQQFQRYNKEQEIYQHSQFGMRNKFQDKADLTLKKKFPLKNAFLLQRMFTPIYYQQNNKNIVQFAIQNEFKINSVPLKQQQSPVFQQPECPSKFELENKIKQHIKNPKENVQKFQSIDDICEWKNKFKDLGFSEDDLLIPQNITSNQNTGKQQ